MQPLTDEQLLAELQRRFQENKKSLIELQELNRELQIVNKKLEESEALKSHFISNITNEIVNPFTSIVNLSKNIQQVERGNSEEIRRMAELIFSEAFILDFQLKNIFAAAEIEAGDINPEINKVDIDQLILNVIESFQHEIQRRRLDVQYLERLNLSKATYDYFRTDPLRFQLVISNLLSNSIKFSHSNGKIEIRCKLLDDGSLKLTVKDYGIGISAEHQQIIFDRFKRVDSGIHSLNRGHGLGLSINKAIVDMLDGIIEVESKIQQGTLFTVIIPTPKTTNQSEDFAIDGTEIFFGENEIF